MSPEPVRLVTVVNSARMVSEKATGASVWVENIEPRVT